MSSISLAIDAEWFFKTKCSSCNEVHENVINFKPCELQELPGSKGYATYIAKCKLCNRTSNIEYQKNTWSDYREEHNEKWHTIATFECRGMELVEFKIGNDWCATSSMSEFTFGHGNGKDVIEFDGPDWCGFDEDGEEAVGIYDFHSQFIRSTKK